jgi:hypothetical protein
MKSCCAPVLATKKALTKTTVKTITHELLWASIG